MCEYSIHVDHTLDLLFDHRVQTVANPLLHICISELLGIAPQLDLVGERGDGKEDFCLRVHGVGGLQSSVAGVPVTDVGAIHIDAEPLSEQSDRMRCCRERFGMTLQTVAVPVHQLGIGHGLDLFPSAARREILVPSHRSEQRIERRSRRLARADQLRHRSCDEGIDDRCDLAGHLLHVCMIDDRCDVSYVYCMLGCVTGVSLGYHWGVTGVSLGCYRGVTGVSLGCHGGVMISQQPQLIPLHFPKKQQRCMYVDKTGIIHL